MKRLLSVLIILSMLLTMLLSLSGCKLFKRKRNFDINGTSIKKFSIVCDAEGLDYNVRAAEYIRDGIKKVTGRELEIIDDSEGQRANEIVVGETSRQISKDLGNNHEGFEFSILAKYGSVALEGNYFVIAAAAYYFVENFVTGEDVTKAEDVPTTHKPVVKDARNFIMLIGDGMGVYQTKLYNYLENTSDFSDGEDGFYGYMFPNIGLSRTNSYSGITDSAAGGTALATGYKTYNDYVGVDKDGKEIKSLTELAAELGKATAVLSTDKDTGATPAAFSSHTLSRDNTQEILLGQSALFKNLGTIIECTNRSSINKSTNEDIETEIRSTLSELGKDVDGFFMMYEEAQIDKKSHSQDMDSTFLALIRFNQAIALFMEYAFYNPDTVVLITADHETCGLLPDKDGKLSYTAEYHTGADVPVFAWGKGTDAFGDKTVENIEIAHFFARMMGVSDFGDQSELWYDEIYGDDDGEGDVPGDDIFGDTPNSDGVTLPIIPLSD